MKTPEQLAEEYLRYENESFYWAKHAFLAGYQAGRLNSEAVQAAMNSPEKQDSCEHILDMEKMVDVNLSSEWISVKDRLPESSVGWTTVYGCILSRWAVQPGFYDKEAKEWVSRFICSDETDQGYAPFESVTHWMPLSKPPKE